MIKVEESARSLLMGRNSPPKTGDDRSRKTSEDAAGKLSRYRANDFHGRWTNCTLTLATRSMETTVITMLKFSLDFVRLTLAGFLLIAIRQRMFMQIHIFTNAIEETGIYFTL